MIRKAFASLRHRSRRRRYLLIRDLARIESLEGFILDLGGGPASFFAAMFPKPDQVILVDVNINLARQAKGKQPALHAIVADGRRLPLADCSVDMTVCNSVIEHVDDPDALVAEICRASRGYFLQTPNGNFPLETHSYVPMPFYNSIPWAWLRRLISKIFGANYGYVSSVRYLSEQGLISLFPEATIAYEMAFGLKKSYYVYRTSERLR